MSYPNYANYLVNSKFQGNIELAENVQRNKCLLELNNSDKFERECEILQCIEVIKASNK
jgi:hypothetical protein